jgi:hypothetical protein
MLKQGSSLTNYNSQRLVDKRRDQSSRPSSPIFVLCDECYWCATLIRPECQ